MPVASDSPTAPAASSRKPPALGMPHLEFGPIQADLIQITSDIQRLHQRSVVDRLRGLFGEEEVLAEVTVAHLNGRDLLPFQADSRESESWVRQLEDDPAFTEPRLKLVLTALSSRHKGTFQDYRNLLIQACLPLYIGHITPKHLQVAVQAYRLYLKMVYTFGKKKILTVRSSQLKGVNVDMISMQDLMKSTQGAEGTPEANLVREVECAVRLMDLSRNLMKNLQASFSIPLDLSMLNQYDPKPSEARQFLGDIHSSRIIPDKKALLSRKVVAVLEVIKEVYPLHALALRVAERMQAIEPKNPIPFLMEGRTRLEALRMLLLRLRCGDTTVDEAVRPTLLRVIEAYYRSVKRTTLRQPSQSDVPILMEFAQVALFTHKQRRVASIPHEQMVPLLNFAQKAMKGVVQVEPAHQRFADLLREVRKRYGLLGDG